MNAKIRHGTIQTNDDEPPHWGWPSRAEVGLTTITILTVLYIIYHCRRSQNIPSSRQSPPSYPHKDPILGLDLFFAILKHREIYQNIQFSQQRHAIYGNTYQAIYLGRRVFHTIQPENIKDIYGSKWQDCGMDRLKAMQSFCGHGFLTVDGEGEWKRLKGMMMPLFSEPGDAEMGLFENVLGVVE